MKPSHRPVRLGGPPELTVTCAVPALAGLVGQGLRLEVTLGRPAELLLEALAAGELDTVIATIHPGEPLAATPLLDEDLVLVAAPGVAGEPEPARLLEALAGISLIAYGEDLPVIRRYWRAAFGALPDLTPHLVVPDLRGVKAAAVAGAGFTVLPGYLCRRELADGRLVRLLDPAPPPAVAVYLATRDPDPGPQVQAVNRRLLEQAPRW